MSTEIKVPDIGDFDRVEIIEVLVKEGDEIEAEAALIVLESDKAAMEVPSPQAGRLVALKVKMGDKVGQGDVIALLEPRESAGDEAPESESAPESEPARQEADNGDPPDQAADGPAPAEPTERSSESPKASKPTAAQPPAAAPPGLGDSQELPHASPSVRRFARELGVDLSGVTGSGPNQRIQREDVQALVKQAMQSPSTALPAMPAVDFSRFGPTERRELSRIRRLSAANLQRSWLSVPHVTQHDDADITALEQFRRDENQSAQTKLTLLPFLLKAVAVALRQYPDFGSSLDPDGHSLIVKKYCHLGFAADTDQGLVVPVIRDVDKKSITELAQEAATLAMAARERKLRPEQMQGGCFTISSLGGIGGSYFTPIVNAPEVAILGVSRARQQPHWDGVGFVPRLQLPLSLSYDHRVIDGAAAARFITRLAELLTDIRRLSL